MPDPVQRGFGRENHEQQNYQGADHLPAFGDRHLGLVRLRKQGQPGTHRKGDKGERDEPLSGIRNRKPRKQAPPSGVQRQQRQTKKINNKAEIEEVLDFEQLAPLEIATKKLAAMKAPQIVQIEFAADILLDDPGRCRVVKEMLQPARFFAEEQKAEQRP